MLAAREFNQALRPDERPWAHISPVYVGRDTGRAFFAVTRRREGSGNGLPPGAYDGVINASMFLDRVNPTLAALATDPSDVISLVRSDGRLLARSAELASVPPDAATLGAGSPMTAAMARGEERATISRRSSVDGVERVAALRRVGVDWPVYAVAARARSAIVSGWRKAMAPQAALAMAATLLLLGLSHAVLRRERRLADANLDLERRVAERTQALAASEAKLRRAQDAAGAVAFEVSAVGLATDVPDVFRALYAIPPGRSVDYAAVLARVHPDDRARFEADHRQLARSGGRFRSEFRVVLPDGSVRWLLTSGEAEPGPPGAALPSRIVGVNIDVTARKAVEDALLESEHFLQLAQQAAGVAAWSWTVGTDRVTWSRSMFELLGLDPDTDTKAMTYDGFMAMVVAEDRDSLTRGLEACSRDGSASVEFRINRRTPCGGHEERWLLCRASVRDQGAGSRVMFGIDIDITERRRAEERQELLLREVDHRAKNALAVVKAALRLTPKEDARSFSDAIEGRIDALARAQSLLAETRWGGTDLRKLLEGSLAPFLIDGTDGPRALLDGPEVKLSGSATQSLSMAIHELATNATKYGALSCPSGQLAVTWHVAGGELRLLWRESGGPRIEAAPGKRGFGSRVVDSTIRNQLGGRAKWQWDADGLAVHLLVPVGRVLTREPATGL
ncbi:HWE histidine kinase domain-containing protein [Falsiroseomonas oryziterrae]|uniref:HWE histidine kinase domain-containing protein n=1 Tax=Falsiroseomonas oryziterrae TaxID=2911368 RepID=UPI001F02E1FA|nr:HWE histidine kinase domain-containing protein [Roseomonas sp. NPKOSM-4]